MTTKLTLSIEQEVIKTAKTYAQAKGRSLSDLIENYLRTLSGKEPDNEELSPKISKLVGSVKLPKNYNYKKNLSEEINKKFSK